MCGPRAARHSCRQATALLLLVSGGHLAGGSWLLLAAPDQPHPATLATTAGVLLVLLAGAQSMLAHRAWHGRSATDLMELLKRPTAWRFGTAGLVAAYLTSLAAVAPANRASLFSILVAAAYTLGLAAFVSRPSWSVKLGAFAGRPAWRAVGWAVYAALLVPLVAEGGLRLYELAIDRAVPQAWLTHRLRPAPGTCIGTLRANSDGYCDNEFTACPRTGTFRVIALGDEVMLGGDGRTNPLRRMERMIPGLELCNLGVPDAAPREYAAQTCSAAVAYQPDMVLVFLSMENDITHEVPMPGVFDPQWLHLTQLATVCLADSPDGAPTAAPVDRETYLRRAQRSLAVCRAPIDDRMWGRWEGVIEHLDEMVDVCRKRDLPLGVVLVPAAFQVDPRLRETLVRRAGYESDEIDPDLPQRRLTAYARDHDLLVLDLLPYMRAERNASHTRNASCLSAHGNDVTAEVVGHWLESHIGQFVATVGRVRR